MSALSATLAALPPEIRDRALRGPDLRGFLSEVETWLTIRRVASEIVAIGPRPRRGARRRQALARLFDRLARTGHLATLVPGGRIDAGLPERCLAFARRRLDDAVADLSAFLLGLRLAYTVAGTIEVRLRFREDPEQGRPAGRIDLGSFAGPAGQTDPQVKFLTRGQGYNLSLTATDAVLVLQKALPGAGPADDAPLPKPGAGLNGPSNPQSPPLSVLDLQFVGASPAAVCGWSGGSWSPAPRSCSAQ